MRLLNLAKSEILNQRDCYTIAFMILFFASPSLAESLIPGTGQQISKVGDDFEDENWSFRHNFPKSSEEIDTRVRSPGGWSTNRRWYEGMKRGQPDVIKRVPTPVGGIEGSQASLLLRTLRTGVPGRPSYQLQQDDFVCNVSDRLGGKIPISQAPSFVVRVFMPPIEEWENRRGPTFAIRAACDTTTTQNSRGLFSRSRSAVEREPYWPGMFINFVPKERSRRDYDTAFLTIRANRRGITFKGPPIETTGWWTFGMSFTPDGQVHYYAKPGIEDLTEEDHITSQYPYGFRCERFKTFFFNVCNNDDYRVWSTSWIIDDPSMYYMKTEQELRQARKSN